MPTDTERREVARRLRELRMTAPGATSVGHGYLRSLFWAVYGDGLRGSTRWNWFERMCSRLADLIEPGGHECVPGECPLNVREMRHSTKEEQAKYGAMLEKTSIGLHPVDREALGVDDAEA